jgi:GTP-binding protein HflX
VRKDLEELERTRQLKRKQRGRTGIPVVALVGYTNAGKSTLLRRFTEARVLVEDRLFSTLDPTTRRLELSPGRAVLLTDTVGFVRKLPHQLVEAFRSTLEEVAEATLLLHMVDASRDPGHQIDAVNTVLAEIGVIDRPYLVAMNKIDLVDDATLDRLRARYPEAVFVSAASGAGLDELRARIETELARLKVEVALTIPFERGDVVAHVHATADVLKEWYEEDGTRLIARVGRESLAELEPWLTEA